MYDNLERLKKLPGSLSSGTASIGCGWGPALELGIGGHPARPLQSAPPPPTQHGEPDLQGCQEPENTGVVQFTIQFPANDHRVPTRDSLASRL